MTENTLYYGDNLDILRRYIGDASVDLIYLDPPFNSNATYNVLFAERNGSQASAQIKAFEDTWTWDQTSALAYQETVEGGGQVSRTLQAYYDMLGPSNMMAYLAMMAPRLVELRRVLKPTGSIYLHCDPTASHYLKVLMDAVFGARNFVNDISWTRTVPKSAFRQGATNWPRVHDCLLFYVRDVSVRPVYKQQFAEYDQEYIESSYPYTEPETGRRYGAHSLTAPGAGSRGHPKYEFLGVTRYWRYSEKKMQQLLEEGRIIQTKPGNVPRYKRYLDEVEGVPIGDMWIDIKMLQGASKERLGYPTQKPEALLERIITASSKEGDLVLDPFCGCGTAIAVAQRLNRPWIGIDITQAAIRTIKERLADTFGGEVQYTVIGEPTTVPDAQALAAQDAYQFQWWALGLVGARPAEGKRGADKGIDGRLYFHDDATAETKQIIFSVKAGNTVVAHVRDLRGVLAREQAEMGVLITMHEPTQPMRTEAASAGFYESPWGQHPRLQLLTIDDLLSGQKVDYPMVRGANVTYEKAPRAKEDPGRQWRIRELL